MAKATLFKEMLEAHPWPAQIDRDVLVRCIDECSACETLCTACADASLAEEDVVDMRKCISLCLDCADICGTTGRPSHEADRVRRSDREGTGVVVP